MTAQSDPLADQPPPSSDSDLGSIEQDPPSASAEPVDFVAQFADPALRDWERRSLDLADSENKSAPELRGHRC